LALIEKNQLPDVIQESAQRHRMSEAELVQGNDPEWDSYLATLETKANAHVLLSLPPIHDVVLIEAIDSLKAIQVTQAPVPTTTAANAAPAASASLQ
jgi:hypothetical protein